MNIGNQFKLPEEYTTPVLNYKTKIGSKDELKRNSILLNKVELEELLEKRITQFGLNIENAFLMVNGSGAQGEFEIDTHWGKLKVFARNNVPGAFLLWRPKFAYPSPVLSVSTKPFESGGPLDDFSFTNKKADTKSDVPKKVKRSKLKRAKF